MTLNELNPSFMKNILMVKEIDRLTKEQYNLNLNTPSYNQITFDYKDLSIFGSKFGINFLIILNQVKT